MYTLILYNPFIDFKNNVWYFAFSEMIVFFLYLNYKYKNSIMIEYYLIDIIKILEVDEKISIKRKI